MDKIKNILKYAISMEKQGENFYTYYADKASDSEIKKLFQHFAEIENSHHRYLKNKYDELYYHKDIQEISWVIDNNKIIRPSIYGNAAQQFTSENDDGLADLTILRMAYSIEDDFSTFYNEASNKMDDKNVKEFLKELSKWEDEHREIFYNLYTKHLKETWGDIL
jgi:rubrerythrin